MTPADWRGGKLLGAAYAFVVDDKVLILHTDKAKLASILEVAAQKTGLPMELAMARVRQVCVVLPPWEIKPNDAD